MNHDSFCTFLEQVTPADVDKRSEQFFTYKVIPSISDFPIVHVLGNRAVDPTCKCGDLYAGMVQAIGILYLASKRLGEKPECDAIRRARGVLVGKVKHDAFGPDLLQSMDEMSACFREGCYVSVLCLGGKILEICLLLLIQRSGKSLDDDAGLGSGKDRKGKSIKDLGIGPLIGYIKEKCPDIYLDPSLPGIANVINASRIPAVHAKEAVPVPSEHQAALVIHAVLDLLDRAFPAKKLSGT